MEDLCIESYVFPRTGLPPTPAPRPKRNRLWSEEAPGFAAGYIILFGTPEEIIVDTTVAPFSPETGRGIYSAS